MAQVPPIFTTSVLIHPETGTPTKLFLQIWESLVSLGIKDLRDVNISNPVNGDTLVYNSSTGKWDNV